MVTDEDTAVNGNVLVNNGNGVDSDVDNATLTVTQVNGQAANVGAQIALASGALLTVNANGTFTYNPNAQFEGLNNGQSANDSFTYQISDGNGGTDTATVSLTINGVNDDPGNVAPDARNDAVPTDENTAALGNVLSDNGSGTDSDVDGDTLTVTQVNGVGANVGTQIALASGALLTVNANGTFNYNPNGQFEALNVSQTANDSFTYQISDGNGGTDTATVALTINGVNDAPDAQNDAVVTDEDTAVNGNVLVNNGNGVDSDVDNATLTVTQVNGQAANVGAQIALASGALLSVNANGTFTYNPNGQFEGLNVGGTANDSFTYQISDGNGGTDTATVSLTINGVNDAPVAQDDAITTNEDTAVNGNVLNANGSGADSDIDNAVLTVAQVNGLTANVGAQIALASGALLTVNANGTFNYNPNGQFEGLNASQTANDSFTYQISDGNGGTDTATVNLTITGVDDVLPTLFLGGAPIRLSTANLTAWQEAWSDPAVTIQHTSDFANANPAYLNVALHGAAPSTPAGGDIYAGDLGVSGRALATSPVQTEIDGTEALRFQLVDDAVELRFGLSRFKTNDDGTGFNESGRLLLLDAANQVIDNISFVANSTSGTQEVVVQASSAFSQAVFMAGANNASEFVFGAYANTGGGFGSAPFTSGGALHGSDYLLDYVEFTFAPAVPDALAANGENLMQVLGVGAQLMDLNQA